MHPSTVLFLLILPAAAFAQANRLADQVAKIGAGPLVIEKAPGSTVLSEADEVGRLQSLEARKIPVQQAPLGEAVSIIATAAEMNFVSPPASDFPETITLNFHGNPYELLQILGDQYRFMMVYRRGVWIFSREAPGAVIGKVYKLKHTNLEAVKVGQNTVVSFGKVSDGEGSTGTNAAGNGLVFEPGESKLVKDLENLLGIVTTARAVIAREGEALPDGADGRAKLETTKGANGEPSAPSTRVVVIPQTNSLLVVCSRAQHDYVRAYLDSVDTPVRQVHLAAQFVSTSHDPSSILGIDHSKLQPNLKLQDATQPVDLNRIRSIRAPENALLSASNLELQLNWLQRDSHSRLEQRASTVASDGSEAAIAVVTEIPYVDSSTTGANLVDGGLGTSRSTVAYRRVGVLINTRMKVFDGENGQQPRVRLNLKITVSELEKSVRLGSSDTPQTNSREYTQTVDVPNGYTLALGGLNSEEMKDAETRVPGLGHLPIVGYLFKSKSKSKSHRSLIAYITPTIVSEGDLIKSEARLNISAVGTSISAPK